METEGVGRWMWMWVGKCGYDKQACDMGGCGRWVPVMELVKIEGMERIGVRKRVRSHTHIDILHLLCTSLTLSSNRQRSNLEVGLVKSSLLP